MSHEGYICIPSIYGIIVPCFVLSIIGFCYLVACEDDNQ